MVADRGHFLIEDIADIVGAGNILLQGLFQTVQQGSVAILVPQDQ